MIKFNSRRSAGVWTTVGLVFFGCLLNVGCAPVDRSTESESAKPTDGQPGVTSTVPAETADGTKEENNTEGFSYSILHWNVESGGNDPATVAAQLSEMGDYDVIGLSEVETPLTLCENWSPL